jgi:hypothetical protein
MSNVRCACPVLIDPRFPPRSGGFSVTGLVSNIRRPLFHAAHLEPAVDLLKEDLETVIKTGELRKLCVSKAKAAPPLSTDEAFALFEKNMHFITRHPDRWSIIDHVRSPCMHEPSHQQLLTLSTHIRRLTRLITSRGGKLTNRSTSLSTRAVLTGASPC